jgi:hypothetical protein
MSRSARLGQAVLVLHGLAFLLISISVWFAPDPLERDAQFLVSNFGVTAGYLIICMAVFGLNSQQPWAWFALWVLPVFYLWLVIANDTPAHLGFAAVAVAALAVSRPRHRVYRSVAPAETSTV